MEVELSLLLLLYTTQILWVGNKVKLQPLATSKDLSVMGRTSRWSTGTLTTGTRLTKTARYVQSRALYVSRHFLLTKIQLCNVMFTRELQKRLSADSTTKGISVNCFSPGLVPRTGLFRNQNPLLSMVSAQIYRGQRGICCVILTSSFLDVFSLC